MASTKTELLNIKPSQIEEKRIEQIPIYKHRNKKEGSHIICPSDSPPLVSIIHRLCFERKPLLWFYHEETYNIRLTQYKQLLLHTQKQERGVSYHLSFRSPPCLLHDPLT